MMETSEISEEVFDSYNLNPRLFINEVLNSVDDLVDGAFQFLSQRASEIAGIGDRHSDNGEEREELARGVSILRNITQAVLDKRLNIWEKYCLHHIFRVPEDFSMQETVISGPGSIPQDALDDEELDNQLENLRDRLAIAERESLKLNKEMQVYRNQSAAVKECDRVIKEAEKLHGKIPMQELFGEVQRMAPILHNKLKRLRVIDEKKSQLTCANKSNGFLPKLEDLKQVLGFIKEAETQESAVL